MIEVKVYEARANMVVTVVWHARWCLTGRWVDRFYDQPLQGCDSVGKGLPRDQSVKTYHCTHMHDSAPSHNYLCESMPFNGCSRLHNILGCDLRENQT